MAYVGAIIAIVGAVTGVIGAIQNHRAQEAALDRERTQRKENIAIARTQAAQQTSTRLQKLKDDKGSNRARGAAYGFSTRDSKSFQTIQERTEKNADDDVANIKVNFLIKRQRELFAIADAEGRVHASKQAMMLSVISGVGQTAKAVSDFSSKNPSGSPSESVNQAQTSPLGWGDISGGDDIW
jgi:hypothetical protein